MSNIKQSYDLSGFGEATCSTRVNKIIKLKYDSVQNKFNFGDPAIFVVLKCPLPVEKRCKSHSRRNVQIAFGNSPIFLRILQIRLDIRNLLNSIVNNIWVCFDWKDVVFWFGFPVIVAFFRIFRNVGKGGLISEGVFNLDSSFRVHLGLHFLH